MLVERSAWGSVDRQGINLKIIVSQTEIEQLAEEYNPILCVQQIAWVVSVNSITRIDGSRV